MNDCHFSNRIKLFYDSFFLQSEKPRKRSILVLHAEILILFQSRNFRSIAITHTLVTNVRASLEGVTIGRVTNDYFLFLMALKSRFSFEMYKDCEMGYNDSLLLPGLGRQADSSK